MPQAEGAGQVDRHVRGTLVATVVVFGRWGAGDWSLTA
jgi:hypothetical protein